MPELIMYLCDGKCECADSIGCTRTQGAWGMCSHTRRSEHAMYGAVEHPEDYPERFDVLRGDCSLIYVEKAPLS